MPRREEIQMARALARSLADPDLSAALASKQGGGAQAKPLCTSNKRAPVLSVPIAKPAEAAAAPVSPLTPLCRHTGEPPRAPGRRAIEQPVPVRPLRSDRRPGGGGCSSPRRYHIPYARTPRASRVRRCRPVTCPHAFDFFSTEGTSAEMVAVRESNLTGMIDLRLALRDEAQVPSLGP